MNILRRDEYTSFQGNVMYTERIIKGVSGSVRHELGG